MTDFENFQRVSQGGEVIVESFDQMAKGNDIIPPSRITTLEIEEVIGFNFTLSWTAVGDDFDDGQGK